MRLRLLLLLCCFFALATSLTGCDSVFQCKGNVFEWVDAPNYKEGEIYVNELPPELPPEGYNLQPIASAKISFDGGKLAVLSSDNEGKFEYWSVVPPVEYNMKITVEKDGYYPVEKKFRFYGDSGEFYFTVMLVRKDK
jgi:hypothetical protein